MRLLYLFTAAALLSVDLGAHADTFSFTFGTASSTLSGSGSLATSAPEAQGEYVISSVTGTARTTLNGPSLAISSILAPETFPTVSNGGTFPANDNTLFVANGVGTLSQDGLSFILSNGAQVNLFNDGSAVDAFLERANGAVAFESVPITITSIATTPEPSSIALFSTGLLGLAGLAKRRLA